MYGPLRQYVADTQLTESDRDNTKHMVITMDYGPDPDYNKQVRISWPQAEYIHRTFDHNTYEVDYDSDFEDGTLDYTLTQQQYQAVLDYGKSKEVLFEILKEE